jgi:hypothetical protein
LSLVVVPASISFIAGNAFPPSCAVTLAGSDCDADFRAWTRRRQFDSSAVFERRTSEIRELATKESGDDQERKASSEPTGQLD